MKRSRPAGVFRPEASRLPGFWADASASCILAPMLIRTSAIGAWAGVLACAWAGCKSTPATGGDASAAGSASGAVSVVAAKPTAPSAVARFAPSPPESWVPKLEGAATGDGVKFGLASCFTETKHCVQVPLGWRTNGQAQAMGGGRIAWAHPANRHVCVAVDRGGSDWAELIRRDEAEQKGYSSPVAVKLGIDEIPATLRSTRFDMADARPYPFHILMWFGCFGVDPEAAANPTGMPAGPATLLWMKVEVKEGLTFNTYAFVSDAASEEEKRDLLATLRGIRALPGRLATHPK